MAVGLQTQKEKVLEFSVAVLVHEVVMAFSFGMEVNIDVIILSSSFIISPLRDKGLSQHSPPLCLLLVYSILLR